MKNACGLIVGTAALVWSFAPAGKNFFNPYSPPCVEREKVFEFTKKPAAKYLGADNYELTFAVKSNCDVTVGVIDEKGVVVRHFAHHAQETAPLGD
jgi:hypothetical protein